MLLCEIASLSRLSITIFRSVSGIAEKTWAIPTKPASRRTDYTKATSNPVGEADDMTVAQGFARCARFILGYCHTDGFADLLSGYLLIEGTFCAKPPLPRNLAR
jgi:hypothetical protein